MKKKNWAILAIFAAAILLGIANLRPKQAAPAAPEGGALFNAGTYEAEAEGFGGAGNPVKLKVTLSDNEIEAIDYTADGETPTVGGAAIPQLIEKVLAAQSPNIDTVSGATITSTAFFTALNNGVISAAISFLRTLVFQIAGVFILPLFFGLDGVWSSLFVAELLATAVTFLFYKFQRSKYHF